MAFLPGLKKQLNKANQFMSEKIGGVEGTRLNEEFTEMERKTDLTAELVEELITKTREYLQPNPATRSKMMLNAKLAQNTRNRNYAQPEGVLGENILRIAHRFSEDSPYVRSLLETGEAFKQMSEIKYALEDDVRQDFLDPLTNLQTKELRDVLFHRKKLQGRRLDFDCKKRRRANGANILDDEMKIAEEKFEESFNAASQGMHNLLQNDVEQISQLVALVDALRDYYKSCGDILEHLSDKLGALRDDSAGRQHSQYVPKKLSELNLGSGTEPSTTGEVKSSNHVEGAGGDSTATTAPATTDNQNPTDTTDSGAKQANETKQHGLCVALYDFQAENPGELGFKEGQTLKLLDQVDENWYEGALEGPDGEQTGIFPTNYVRITEPMPSKETNNRQEQCSNTSNGT